jgi:hypothetical protein
MSLEAARGEDRRESDVTDLARRVMEDTLIPLFLEEQANHKIGFTKISRLIRQEPGGYLWTRERKGAYLA